jgi:hypothetical protein
MAWVALQQDASHLQADTRQANNRLLIDVHDVGV